MTCDIPHEEFREFTSAECLEDVRHIVDIQANALECGGLSSRRVCENADKCTWCSEGHAQIPTKCVDACRLPDFGVCAFDHWLYFHDISSTNGIPDGYDEVSDMTVFVLLLEPVHLRSMVSVWRS